MLLNYNKRIDFENMEHYLRADSRIKIIENLIKPFQSQLEYIFENSKKEGHIYWDSVYAEDTEHIVGTVFIILQNYINSSISDLYPELTKLYTKYEVDKKINNSNSTRIELIISIANYYKHRDLPTDLRKDTAKHFENLGIEYKYFYDSENSKYFHKIGADSPVFSGLSYLSDSWDFNDLIQIVSEWRENLWLTEE